jgi:probable rRNA maturation factor
MIHIRIAPPYKRSVVAANLERAAQATLQHHSALFDGDLSVVVGDDAQLSRLNQAYRGVAAPTDVLAFPSDESDPDSGRLYLGDVIISYPQALEQARSGGHSAQDELALLVVHGVLHLLGYDHTDPQEKERMWAVQKEVIAALGMKVELAP